DAVVARACALAGCARRRRLRRRGRLRLVRPPGVRRRRGHGLRRNKALKLTAPRADNGTMDSYQWYLVAVFAVVIASLLWAGKTYNRLIRLRNRAEAMWAEIDVQLKRRHDLVPNLVHVVEGYATHERGTLDEDTRARSQAIAARQTGDQSKAENVLTASLGRLFADAESYPNLEAAPEFKDLQDQLEQ